MPLDWIPRPGQWVLFHIALPPQVLGRQEQGLPAIHKIEDAEGEWLVGIWDPGGISGLAINGQPEPPRPARIMLCDVNGNNVEAMAGTPPRLVNIGFALDQVAACKPMTRKEHFPPGYVGRTDVDPKP